jgi:DNA-binding transcriptional LysR family regulator
VEPRAASPSFTQAAQELLTQSAISQEVKALEEQLGAPLFTRVNRTLRLTQAGEQLYRATDEALALIDAAAEQVAGAARSLSITTTVPFASLWLGPRLHDFARRHPDIRLRVVASNDNLDIVREHIDIAIRHTPTDASLPNCIEHETFRLSPIFLQSGSSHRVSRDLASHVLLDRNSRNGRYDWRLAGCDESPRPEARRISALFPL